MIGYGFGYDEELPRGFQDADIEMRELEDAANERKREIISLRHYPATDGGSATFAIGWSDGSTTRGSVNNAHIRELVKRVERESGEKWL